MTGPTSANSGDSILHGVLPGGSVEFVLQFLDYLRTDRLEEAAEAMDPEFGSVSPSQLDLEFLGDPGWGRLDTLGLTPEGDEIVHYVFKEGSTRVERIDKPTLLLGCDFVVRHGPSGWSLVSVGPPGDPDNAGRAGPRP